MRGESADYGVVLDVEFEYLVSGGVRTLDVTYRLVVIADDAEQARGIAMDGMERHITGYEHYQVRRMEIKECD